MKKNEKEFIELEINEERIIEIKVGMGASGIYWTDVTPFEVVKIISDKTVEIRELDYEIIAGDYLDPTYKYYSNDETKSVRVRKCKNGWRTSTGMRIYFGHARKYYDPSF